MALLTSIQVDDVPTWDKLKMRSGAASGLLGKSQRCLSHTGWESVMEQASKPKTYLRINERGDVRYVRTTKHRLATYLDIPYRDLRSLDPVVCALQNTTTRLHTHTLTSCGMATALPSLPEKTP